MGTSLGKSRPLPRSILAAAVVDGKWTDKHCHAAVLQLSQLLEYIYRDTYNVPALTRAPSCRGL